MTGWGFTPKQIEEMTGLKAVKGASMTTKHTPTPWETYAGSIVRIPKGAWVAETRLALAPNEPHAITQDERVANAAFIVLACNAHDKLVAALRDVLADIATGFIANPSKAGERCLDRHEKAIRAALKGLDKETPNA